MNAKRYLKLSQKIAYGTGDVAGNSSYTLLSSFILIYLTNTVGLNSGIIGILMMVSKIFDGFTDVIFGVLIDRTKSKLGKARPWMLYSQIGVSACLFLLFTIPAGSQTMQYVYFFIFYTAFNAIFYTANNISYGSLVALITKNVNERVQLGSFRLIFALLTNIVVSSVVMDLVQKFGGGSSGWRAVALIFAVLSMAINTFSCFMVKEVPMEENEATEQDTNRKQAKIGFVQAGKYLLTNKYLVIILLYYLCTYIMGGITQGAGVYYMTYILGDASLLGTFTMAQMFPMALTAVATPFLVKWFKGMWKVNTAGYILNAVFGIVFIFAALNKNIPLMLGLVFIRGLCSGPMNGTLNALIAETSGNIYRLKKVRMEGMMYSCSSFGVKLGGGIGSAVCGWLLEAGGFDGMASVQTQGALNMIQSMYVFIPVALSIVMAVLASMLNVEKANQKWDEEHRD